MTYNAECTNKPNKNGLFQIYIRTTENRNHKRIATAIFLTSNKHFSAKAKYGTWVSSAAPNYKELNEAIKKEIVNITNFNLDLNHQKQLFINLKDKYSTSFDKLQSKYEYFQSIVKPSDNRKLLGIMEQYRTNKIKLQIVCIMYKLFINL